MLTYKTFFYYRFWNFQDFQKILSSTETQCLEVYICFFLSHFWTGCEQFLDCLKGAPNCRFQKIVSISSDYTHNWQKMSRLVSTIYLYHQIIIFHCNRLDMQLKFQ